MSLLGAAHGARCRAWRAVSSLALAATLGLLGGCSLLPLAGSPGPDAPVAGYELGRSDDFAIVVPGRSDSLPHLAGRYLGDARLWWWIADANDLRRDADLDPGQPLRIPLRASALFDIDSSGQQVVPVLAYHGFDDSGAQLSVSGETFEQHLEYLREHDYRVVSLQALERWLAGAAPLPRRAVVLTMDDGYRSVYEQAYPRLLKYRYPATVFVYTDFVGNGGLSWSQLREMRASGLVSVQSHSRSHVDLGLLALEDARLGQRRLHDETAGSRRLLVQQLGGQAPQHYAYPYGATSPSVVDSVARNGFSLAFTVRPGGNTFYRDQMLLRRSMVFSDRGMQGFADSLETWRSLPDAPPSRQGAPDAG